MKLLIMWTQFIRCGVHSKIIIIRIQVESGLKLLFSLSLSLLLFLSLPSVFHNFQSS